MNKSESKYFNTANRMDQAFIEILEKKDLEYISIKEICSKAHVNRSTFYLHYENIGDLLEESVRYMNDMFLEYFNEEGRPIIKSIHEAELDELFLVTPAFLVPYLSFIRDHRRLFSTALNRSSVLQLNDTYKRLFEHVLSPIMDRFSIEEREKKYLASYYMSGILAIIRTWLSDDCKEDIDFIIDIICGQIKRGKK